MNKKKTSYVSHLYTHKSEKLNAKKKNPCYYYCVAAALQDEEEELTQVSNTPLTHQQ
jgi:hypothetical protein